MWYSKASKLVMWCCEYSILPHSYSHVLPSIYTNLCRTIVVDYQAAILTEHSCSPVVQQSFHTTTEQLVRTTALMDGLHTACFLRWLLWYFALVCGGLSAVAVQSVTGPPNLYYFSQEAVIKALDVY